MRRTAVQRNSMRTFILTLAILAFSNPMTVSATPSILETNNITKLEQLDAMVESQMIKVDQANQEVVKNETEIKLKEAEIKHTEEELKSQQDIFNKRVRAIYTTGASMAELYASILIDSNGFNDFLEKSTAIYQIMSYDTKLINNIKSTQEKMLKQKMELDKKKSKLALAKAQSERTLAELQEEQEKVKELAAQFNNEEHSPKIDAALQTIAFNKKISEKNSLDAGNSLVVYASQFLGTPYVWGGTTPSGFDCSGFVQYVYNHYNISLNRVAADQQLQGTSVSKSDLQPGDLVFFGLPAHHVGIYVGNGCFIHAPHTGDVVKVSSLDNYTDYSIGKRFIK